MTVTLEVYKFDFDEFIQAVKNVGLMWEYVSQYEDVVEVEISAEGGFGTSENAKKLWELGTKHAVIMITRAQKND